MNSNFVVKLALSTAFVAVPTLGCTSLGISSTSEVSSAKAGPQKAHGWARKAEKHLAKGQTDRALTFAELAVEADMQNRDYRALLARIYMAQGRFASAERTLMDVMDLGQTDPRTVVSLALARIAQGQVDSAISLIDANQSIIPVSDYGLTLALAGQSGRAVALLGEAIRADNASARTRQNLALSYALEGRWREARIMAVQDMSQDKVNDRIVEWAQYARPGAYQLRIAGLLNVTPRDDAGQPVRLALNSIPARLAGVQAEPVAMPVMDAPVELAAIGPAPVADSAGFAAVESDTKIATIALQPLVEAPLIKAPVEAVKTVVSAPIRIAMVDVPASNTSGTHQVQLGAFSSAASAQRAWSEFSKRFGVLNGLNFVNSKVTVNGKTLVRLAAAGFDNRASAVSACRQIRSMGGACIIRDTGGQPVRLAGAKNRRVAAR